MTDSNLRWIPRFDFGDHFVVLAYPVTRWLPGARTNGTFQKSATGIPGPVLLLRRYTLGLTLRFTEDQWDDLRAWIIFAQTGRSFLWSPGDITTPDNPDGLTPISVILDTPAVKDVVKPARDGQMPWLLTLDVTFLREDTLPWGLEYFKGTSNVNEGLEATAYRVSVNNFHPPAASDITVTAQLIDQLGHSIAEAGHTITWSTSNGGSFASSTSVTDGVGAATVAFTTSSDGNITTAITAVDENDLTGTSNPITTTALSDVATHYIVTSTNLAPNSGETVVITAQLVDDDENPIAEPGHTITWSKTGFGGSFASPTSTTDDDGQASVVFTVSTTLGVDHVVTATDENDLTGESDTIHITDPLDIIRGIGNCELLIDAISSNVVINGSNQVTSVDDISGTGRVMTPGSNPFSNPPTWTPTAWNGTLPAFIFNSGGTMKLMAQVLSGIPQPVTFVIVMTDYPQGSGNQNIMNGGDTNNGGPISYYQGGTWFMYAGGSPLNTGIPGDSTKKTIRFDIFNGGASTSYRGTFQGNVGNPGSLGVATGQLGLGASSGNFDPASATVCAFIVYSKALSTADMNDIMDVMEARYGGFDFT